MHRGMRPFEIAVALVLLTPWFVHAKPQRSHSAKAAFQRGHPCPSTGLSNGNCKGFVIDHVKPLACGGADKPENMQWQTKSEAKAKDKWERKECGK